MRVCCWLLHLYRSSSSRRLRMHVVNSLPRRVHSSCGCIDVTHVCPARKSGHDCVSSCALSTVLVWSCVVRG